MARKANYPVNGYMQDKPHPQTDRVFENGIVNGT